MRLAEPAQATDNKVVQLSRRRPDAGLETLERMTGLRWGRMPRSLVNHPDENRLAAPIPEVEVRPISV